MGRPGRGHDARAHDSGALARRLLHAQRVSQPAGQPCGPEPLQRRHHVLPHGRSNVQPGHQPRLQVWGCGFVHVVVVVVVMGGWVVCVSSGDCGHRCMLCVLIHHSSRPSLPPHEPRLLAHKPWL